MHLSLESEHHSLISEFVNVLSPLGKQVAILEILLMVLPT